MTASKGNRGAAGYAFGGAKARGLADRLRAAADENAKRVQCPHCSLTIAAAGLDRHISLCHEDDD